MVQSWSSCGPWRFLGEPGIEVAPTAPRNSIRMVLECPLHLPETVPTAASSHRTATASAPTHPPRTTEIDVPYTFCILGPTMANRIGCDHATGVVSRLGTAFVLTSDNIGVVLDSVAGAFAMTAGCRHAGDLRCCGLARI